MFVLSLDKKIVPLFPPFPKTVCPFFPVTFFSVPLFSWIRRCNGPYNQNIQNRKWGVYRIYPYKRPLPINRRPPSSETFAKFIFRGFTSLSTATSHTIPGFRKKMGFSTSPIEYCLQEIKKITTKHGNFDHRCIKICKIQDKSL